jgi:peroxiredoxin
VLAVSVDPPEASEALRRKLDLPMRFLSDERGVLMDALGIRDRDGLPGVAPPGWRRTFAARASRDIFLPTTFLLDEEGVIRWVYRPDSYRVRAPAAEVLRAIDALG